VKYFRKDIIKVQVVGFLYLKKQITVLTNTAFSAEFMKHIRMCFIKVVILLAVFCDSGKS